MQANRRCFLMTGALSLAGIFWTRSGFAVGGASQVQPAQLIYSGGNWKPRPTALRRLLWEMHKRCAVDTALEPIETKALVKPLSRSPFVYMAGDRSFVQPSSAQIGALRRFLNLGGTLLIDTARTPGGDASGFDASVADLVGRVLPKATVESVTPAHVIFRSFYQLDRPVGRVLGPPQLTGLSVGDRTAVILSRHDLGGAWARDNLGNWEYAVEPGGDRQRENAFRLGINILMYALCLDYKNEEPHRRFGRESAE